MHTNKDSKYLEGTREKLGEFETLSRLNRAYKKKQKDTVKRFQKSLGKRAGKEAREIRHDRLKHCFVLIKDDIVTLPHEWTRKVRELHGKQFPIEGSDGLGRVWIKVNGEEIIIRDQFIWAF